MKLEFKFMISAILFTIGCLVIYGTRIYALGVILINVPILITRPPESKRLKWNAKNFFEHSTIILGLVIVIILCIQIPETQIDKILSKWYFMGPFWLFGLSGHAHRYLKEKEQARGLV